MFAQTLKLFGNAVSLGGVESLWHAPLAFTHKNIPEDMKKKLGLK